MGFTVPQRTIPGCWEMSRPFLLYSMNLTRSGWGGSFITKKIPEMKLKNERSGEGKVTKSGLYQEEKIRPVFSSVSTPPPHAHSYWMTSPPHNHFALANHQLGCLAVWPCPLLPRSISQSLVSQSAFDCHHLPSAVALDWVS